MAIALIADVHANYPALHAVLAELDAAGCEAVYCLGDVAGYGCMLNECADELRRRGIPTLRGNHDDYLASGAGCPRSRSANVSLQYQMRTVTAENAAWLAGLVPSGLVPRDRLPFDAAEGLAIAHGGWRDPLDEYLYRPTAAYFAELPGRRFASGHTHVQRTDVWGDVAYCNPGAVGQPRDGDPRAAYALFDGTAFALRRVPYDVDAMTAAMRRAGFDPPLYENLYAGTAIGGRNYALSPGE